MVVWWVSEAIPIPVTAILGVPLVALLEANPPPTEGDAATDVAPTVPAPAAIFGANYGFMLPVSTPPDAIVHSSGLAPITRMLKAGIVFDIIGAVPCRASPA